jgi:hypothetical protein
MPTVFSYGWSDKVNASPPRIPESAMAATAFRPPCGLDLLEMIHHAGAARADHFDDLTLT